MESLINFVNSEATVLQEIGILGIIVAGITWYRKVTSKEVAKVEKRLEREISRLEKSVDQANERLLECERVRESLLLKITDKFSV